MPVKTIPATAQAIAPDAPVPKATTPEPEHLLNRELSWLEFNRRVLQQATDERTPLLERLAFLAIFNSNLDEFFQKRVGGLKRQLSTGTMSRTPDGMTPGQQLEAIREQVVTMLQEQARCYQEQVLPRLAEQGIYLMSWQDMSGEERGIAHEYFHRNLFPVLTPLSVDPGHPFPFISNLSTSLGVMLRQPDAPTMRDDDDLGGLQFARVKVPQVLPRWVRLQGEGVRDGYRFVHLQEIIRHNLQHLFEGMDLVEVEPFRITRNADVEREEEDAEDLLELIEQELRDRRFADVVRLEVDDEPHVPMNRFLQSELRLKDHDVYEMPGELDYTDLWTVHGVNEPQLKFPSWTPVVPPRLADDEADIFSVIRGSDVLVHHPYESFSASVERFVRAAVADPDVIAIKSTLYRTSTDSPFIPELIRAAEQGKQVAVLVELKARFDEERNVQIAQLLEKSGVHVVYGVMGFKTHTKTTLVVRREDDVMRTYAHIGTGNYNSKTANLYTDLGLLTAREDLTGEIVQLFHSLTGRSRQKHYDKLLIAPINMRRRFVEMIDREIQLAETWKQRGADENDPRRPRIVAKMNSLEDKKMVGHLYRASQAGVKIDLLVRGFCCLRPGVPGLSDNVRVISVIGRFLEHSRVFYFHADSDRPGGGEFYIGSADWMYRNLNNRVECITPVEESSLKGRLWHILDTMMRDHRQAWEMHSDGRYELRSPEGFDENTPEALGTQETLMRFHRSETAGTITA